MLNPNTGVMVFEDGAFELAHERRVHYRITDLVRRGQRTRCVHFWPCEDTQQSSMGSGPSSEPNHAGTLIWHFQPSDCEK